MDGLERAGLHTSTCWSPCEKTGGYTMQILSSWCTSRDIHAFTTKHRGQWEHGTHVGYLIPCVWQHHAFTPIQRGRPPNTSRASHVQTHKLQA